MRVPFHLRHLPRSEPATAALVPSPRRETDALLALCARLGLDPSGRVFAVAGGFLVLLARPTSEPLAGAVRLRSLAPRLFVPVDAELVPTLLDDEAEGLTRDRGLVFAPDGRVLAFAAEQPLALASLVTTDLLARRPWQPPPTRPRRADRLEEIHRDRPEDGLDALWRAEGSGIGSEEPRPDNAPAARTVLGHATLGAGRGLVWLGGALGLSRLSRLGARWIQQALTQAPQLSEAVLGRQESALRSLLRDFREGNLDRALRRALPLGERGGRGRTIGTGAELPQNDFRYSLRDLLGGTGSGDPGGSAQHWLGGFDVQAELVKEYRKAAEQAMRQGDVRRAALIYGKLLRDYLSAANALLQGGLYHDAAVLFLTKRNDPQAAARAYEAGGEFDRALSLYRRAGDHLAAGDLLRRLGEETAAIAEYQTAAERMVRSRHGHLAAGDLMLLRAGRADLARTYFQAGWDRRPSPEAFPCALRLARIHAETPEPEALQALLGQADTLFAAPGHTHEASLFYNEIALLVERPALSSIRDELRDRVLLGLAAKLRQAAVTGHRPGPLVSSVLGRARAWAPAVVSDAEFAVQTEPQRQLARARSRPPAPTPAITIPIHDATVLAVAHASGTDEVFLGFEDGSLHVFRPALGEAVRVGHFAEPIAALAVDPQGQFVAVLRQSDHEGMIPLDYLVQRSGGVFAPPVGRCFPADDGDGDCWLSPVVPQGFHAHVALGRGQRLAILRGLSLMSLREIDLSFCQAEPSHALLIPWAVRPVPELAVLVCDGGDWCLIDAQGTLLRRHPLNWVPGRPRTSSLRAAPLSWLPVEPTRLELAGIDETGVLHWSSLSLDATGLLASQTLSTADEESYLAAALVRPGMVAGVTRSRVVWLRSRRNRLEPLAQVEVSLPWSIACAASHRTNDLIVVGGDGRLVRVPRPPL